MATTTDGQLLSRYLVDGDQSAFAELMHRHAAMVYATARRLAGPDAEDVTQAVFLLLAQRGRRLTDRASLAGWLHHATRACAANARRGRGRHERKIHHLKESAMTTTASSHSVDVQVSDLLDRAIAHLPTALKQVLLLRYVESRDVSDTAEQLGLTTSTVTKRCERAITRMRDFFARHGRTVSDGALLAALPASSMPDVPLTPEVASAKATELARGATPKPSWRMRAAVAVAGLVVLLGGVASVVQWGGSTPTPPPTLQAAVAPATNGVVRVRIGTYDSRAIAVAYAASPFMQRDLDKLMQELRAAEAAEDAKLAASIKEKGAALQRQMHRQGFGNAPVDELLAKVKDQLPDLAGRLSVGAIGRSFDFHAGDVEVIDITDDLVQLYSPNARTLKMIESLRKQPPVDADTIEKMGAKD
ncbi:MAG: sigma-70 family RNA polymerase sigma factor [Tepidisphaeraceae bacterium]